MALVHRIGEYHRSHGPRPGLGSRAGGADGILTPAGYEPCRPWQRPGWNGKAWGIVMDAVTGGAPRRALLLGGVALLAGCTRQAPTEGATRAADRSSAAASPSTSPTASATPTPTPTPTPSPTLPAGSAPWAPVTVPSREAIVAGYAGRAPQQWGMEVAGVTTRLANPVGVALTFDACGGPGGGSGYDRGLIDFLRSRQVPATLFLNQRWIAANPGLTAELVADPLFEVENHGTRHMPLSVTGQSAYKEAGTKDVGEAYDEVTGADAWFLQTMGHRPWFFRTGTAHYDEVATALCADVGQRVAGFSINGDAGTTFTTAQVAQEVGRAKPGDIVIGHMNRPGRGTAPGVSQAVPRMLDAGIRFVRLREGF